jgi:hypothetical protein
MRRLAAAAVLICILMGSAHPQSWQPPQRPVSQDEQDRRASSQAEQDRIQREQEAQRNADAQRNEDARRIKDRDAEELDENYQRALKASRIPAASRDPWQKLRPARNKKEQAIAR